MSLYAYGDGALRLYDGASPTPYYLEAKFIEAGLRAPTGRPRPEERLVLDRGRLDALSRYLRGPDAAILEPQEIRFSALVDSAVTADLLDALAVGTVGGNAWTSTKGASQVVTGAGALAATPAFADAAKKTVDVEVLWTSEADLGFRWREVWFPPERARLSEEEGGVSLEIAGLVFGAIERIAAFSAGVNSASA